MKRTKNIICCLLILVAGLLFIACSGEKRAADLYETAVFEEQQFNSEHAKQLYQEIIDKFPDTETALKARQSLERLASKPDDNR